METHVDLSDAFSILEGSMTPKVAGKSPVRREPLVFMSPRRVNP